MVLAAVTAITCLLPLAATAQQSRRSAAELMDAVMWNKEPIGGDFTLTDHTGKTRTIADYKGKLLLIYFGFTFCPDICPTDLQEITLAMDRLGADADKVQPLLITLDPRRDTVEHLAQYVTLFHKTLVALTGSDEQVAQAAEAYRVYYRRVTTGNKPDDYTVDHSAFIYVVDANGNYLGFFPPGTDSGNIAGMLKPLVTAR